MKNILRISVIIFVLLSIFNYATAMGRQYESSLDLNQPAPDFSLLDIEGNEISLADFKDKKNVLLFFWTTWCPGCRRQIRYIDSIKVELKENDTEILAIDIAESLSKIERFAADYSVTFKILLDKDGEVSEDYDVFGVPTYVIIDKLGTIKYVANSFPEDYKNYISE
ncbi:MAG: peroxiredoxin family protein [Candidatus Omnitrophota bacterium]